MKVRNRVSGLIQALVIVAIGSILTLLSALDLLDNEFSFVLLTLTLTIYLLLEIGRVRTLSSDRWLLNPAVFCSIFTFLMGYGVTNIIFFLSDRQLSQIGLISEITPEMVKLMWGVLLGAVALWLGYWSPVAAHFSSPKMIAGFREAFLPKTNSVRPFALPVLAFVGIAARLLQINLGIYGYSGTYDRLLELGGVTQYISMAAGMGKLALVLAALQYYTSRATWREGMWFYGLLIIELIFGILSGFKSAIVLPIITVAICQYLRYERISRIWVILAILGIFVAFAIVEPFRVARNESLGYQGNTAGRIADTIISSSNLDDIAESAPALLSTMGRWNLTYPASLGISFSDENANLPAGSPAFVANIILAPLYAWIPRFIWTSKPVGDLGLWYTNVVVGMDSYSSTAMGPFTYLYFAGGFIAIFLGFLFIGIMQRALFSLLQPGTSSAGATTFLAMLTTISVGEATTFDLLLVTLFRELPLLILLQFFIFGRSKG
jgi:hypothetical protein